MDLPVQEFQRQVLIEESRDTNGTEEADESSVFNPINLPKKPLQQEKDNWPAQEQDNDRQNDQAPERNNRRGKKVPRAYNAKPHEKGRV
jgi:hypothetical protein